MRHENSRNGSAHGRELIWCKALKIANASIEDILIHMCGACRDKVLKLVLDSIKEELPDEGFIEVEVVIRHRNPFKEETSD